MKNHKYLPFSVLCKKIFVKKYVLKGYVQVSVERKISHMRCESRKCLRRHFDGYEFCSFLYAIGVIPTYFLKIFIK